ncbi:MAG: phosphate starvation-inducible protein PhoH [Cytophagales bacterium]|nr:MAG: phosphate starvation-inducible protein PhoH [Cytophagales bacterium]
MIEKKIKIEDVSPLELFGVQNYNLKELAAHFSEAKITARGEEIILNGKPSDISKISDILAEMTQQIIKYGEINKEKLKEILTPTITLDNGGELAPDVILHGIKGHPIKAKSANQAKMVKAIHDHDLVFAVGPAGTGKTFVAVAMAVRALKRKEVKKIIVTRPAVEAGESLGFLPGDMKEKIDPYIRPIYDALSDMIEADKLKIYEETGVIEIAPLAYMRGRTLNNAFVLLDEAQNATPMQIKMFLTRLGLGSKMVITGDKTQIDLPIKQKSGLIDALEVLKDVKSIAVVTLDAKDVTRHPLVREIIKAYDN